MSATELIAAFKDADFTQTEPNTYRSKPWLPDDFKNNFFTLMRGNGINPNKSTGVRRDSTDPHDDQAAFIDDKGRIVLDPSIVRTIESLSLKP